MLKKLYAALFCIFAIQGIQAAGNAAGTVNLQESAAPVDEGEKRARAARCEELPAACSPAQNSTESSCALHNSSVCSSFPSQHITSGQMLHFIFEADDGMSTPDANNSSIS